MKNILPVVQIILAVLLTASILVQHRGTGLGGAFASDSNVYRSKRGIEKFLFYFTIVLAVVFVTVVIANTILK